MDTQEKVQMMNNALDNKKELMNNQIAVLMQDATKLSNLIIALLLVENKNEAIEAIKEQLNRINETLVCMEHNFECLECRGCAEGVLSRLSLDVINATEEEK